MKVILLHPATYADTAIPEDMRIQMRREVVMLSSYAPLETATIMNFEFVEWVDWLRQMNESIQALNGN